MRCDPNHNPRRLAVLNMKIRDLFFNKVTLLFLSVLVIAVGYWYWQTDYREAA